MELLKKEELELLQKFCQIEPPYKSEVYTAILNSCNPAVLSYDRLQFLFPVFLDENAVYRFVLFHLLIDTKSAAERIKTKWGGKYVDRFFEYYDMCRTDMSEDETLRRLFEQSGEDNFQRFRNAFRTWKSRHKEWFEQAPQRLPTTFPDQIKNSWEPLSLPEEGVHGESALTPNFG